MEFYYITLNGQIISKDTLYSNISNNLSSMDIYIYFYILKLLDKSKIGNYHFMDNLREMNVLITDAGYVKINLLCLSEFDPVRLSHLQIRRVDFIFDLEKRETVF